MPAYSNEIASIRSLDLLMHVVDRTFSQNWASIINDASQCRDWSKEVITDRRGERLAFVNRWISYEDMGTAFTASPKYETMPLQYIDLETARKAKGLEFNTIDFANPIAQVEFMGQVAALAKEAAWLRTREIISLLKNGDNPTSPLGYDGKTFFATDHTLNGQNFCNLFYDLPLTMENLNKLMTVFSRVPIGPPDPFTGEVTFLPIFRPNMVLLIPPLLRMKASLVLQSESIYKFGYLATNPFLNLPEMKIMVNTLLNDQNDYYIILPDLNGIRPFATIKHVTSNDGAIIPRISDSDPLKLTNNTLLWNSQLIEKTSGVHFYQALKVVNSGSSI
jgi:hypothetical protein